LIAKKTYIENKLVKKKGGGGGIDDNNRGEKTKNAASARGEKSSGPTLKRGGTGPKGKNVRGKCTHKKKGEQTAKTVRFRVRGTKINLG